MTFPVYPMGFMGASSFSSAAPNASATGPDQTGHNAADGAILTNLPNAYTPGAYPPYAVMSGMGNNDAVVNTTNRTAYVEALYSHSPTSGLVANSMLTIEVDLDATFTVTSSIKGAAQYASCFLQLKSSGTFSDATVATGSPNPLQLLMADGTVAASDLASGKGYSVSYNGTATVTIGPFSGKTLDIYNVQTLVQIVWLTGFSGGVADTGVLLGDFSCKVSNFRYYYA